MRGIDHQQADMYSYLSPEMRVKADHPLRSIRAMADRALANMSERFDGMYAKTGLVQHEPREKCARTRAKRPKRAAVRTSYSPPYSSAVLHFHFGKIRVTDFARKGPFFRILLELRASPLGIECGKL